MKSSTETPASLAFRSRFSSRLLLSSTRSGTIFPFRRRTLSDFPFESIDDPVAEIHPLCSSDTLEQRKLLPVNPSAQHTLGGISFIWHWLVAFVIQRCITPLRFDIGTTGYIVKQQAS